jgi:hypothetical protein
MVIKRVKELLALLSLEKQPPGPDDPEGQHCWIDPRNSSRTVSLREIDGWVRNDELARVLRELGVLVPDDDDVESMI